MLRRALGTPLRRRRYRSRRAALAFAVLAAAVTPAIATGAITPALEQSPSATLDPGIEAQLNQLQAEEQAYEGWLQSPEAVKEREYSRSAFSALNDDQALDLFRARYGRVIDNATQPLVDPDRIESYRGDNAVVLKEPEDAAERSAPAEETKPSEVAAESGFAPADPASEPKPTSVDSNAGDGSGGLVESTLPLRVTDDAGNEGPVDLGLEALGEGFRPSNAIVDLTLPERLGSGVEIGNPGNSIRFTFPDTDPDAKARRLGDSSLFFANVAKGGASDLVVSARPTGVELYSQIRSLEAPEAERFQLDLPEGATLRAVEGGSIAIIGKAGEPIGRITPPMARDAQGQVVPVSMRVDGSSFIVEADFKGGDFAAPILIDPVVETYTSGGFGTSIWPAYVTPSAPFSACPGPYAACSGWNVPFIYSPSGTYPAASYGMKYWTIPNGNTASPDDTTAWIQSATFSNVIYSGNAAQPLTPFFQAGVLNTRTNTMNASQVNAGNQSFSGATFTLTPPGTYPGPVDDGQQVRFMLGDFSSGATSHSGNTAAYDFGGITINTTDPEAPANGQVQGVPSGWVKTNFSVSMPVNDPGLGAYKAWLWLPTVGGTVDLGEPALYSSAEAAQGCTGTRLSPCPHDWTAQFNVSAGTLAEGHHKLFLWSGDPLANIFVQDSHITATNAGEIRVDRSGPTLKLSDSLADAVEGDLENKQYPLKILARDGSSESPDEERSGVKQITVKLDGTQVAAWGPNGCADPKASCEASLDYTLDATSMSGTHKLEITATDQLDNLTKRTLDLSIKGQAGVIITPKAGDTTARRFGLQAERRDPSMNYVTFEYRRPGVGGWAAIPAARLTDGSGNALTSGLLALDVNGKSPSVTWDVPPTVGGGDGKVNVRARFTSSAPVQIQGTGPPPAQIEADHPLSHWRLGEDSGTAAADSSGNGRAGTYVGGPALNAPGALAAGDDGSVDLDGNDDSINTSYNPFQNGTIRTFEGWANRDTSTTDDALFGSNAAATSSRLVLLAGGNDVRWDFDVSLSGGNLIWANAWPGNNRWVHWALVVNEATDAVSLYINGSLVSTQTTAEQWHASTAPLQIGMRDGNANPFDGKLDEVAVFGTALTASDIQRHMNGDGPLLWWRLGEDSGTAAADSSGNGRTGAYVGSPTLNAAGALALDDDGAVDLDGSSQRVTSSYSPFTAGSTRTFEGWAKRDTSTTIDNIFAGTGGGGPHPVLQLTGGSNDARFFANVGSSNSVSWTNAWPGNGQWVHWALTYNDATKSATLYINGQSKGAKTLTSGYSATPGNFEVGVRGTSTDHFDGKFDEVAVFGTALSANSLQHHMNGLSPTVPDPSIFWRLGEPDGYTAADSSGSDRDGTYVGPPTLNQPGPSQLGAADDGAIDLNGSSQYVKRAFDPNSIGDFNPFAIGATRTFASWASRDTNSTPDTLFGGQDLGEVQTAPQLLIQPGSNDVTWRPTGTTIGAQSVTWSNAWPGAGAWAHWALVYNDQTRASELFVNGVSKGMQVVPTNSYYNDGDPDPLILGARANGTTFSDHFDGKLDEFSIYDHALSAGEIAALKDNGSPEKGFSQVVPLTLDRDTTTSKHASAPVGPGTLDLLTGNYSVTADDVNVPSWGSNLTVSRTFNSRAWNWDFMSIFGAGWASSIPVDDASSDYIKLDETGPSGDASAQVKVTTSDTTEILFSRSGSGYQVEPIYTGMELSRDGNQYVVKDLDGSTTTFYQPTGGQSFLPLKATQTGAAAQNSTRYGFEGSGASLRPSFAVAPTPVGVGCTTTDSSGNHLVANPPRGCRWLTFNYVDVPGPFWSTYRRLGSVTFHGWKPGDSSATAINVAQYEYDNTARLQAEWDPRISPALKTTYTYVDAGSGGYNSLQTITPPGENPWTLSYQAPLAGDDPNVSRLATVVRNVPGVGNATTAVAYGVPLAGGNGAPNMTPGAVDDWGQTDFPTDATAIIPPNKDTGSSQSDLSKATIYYMNRNGDLVNQASPNTDPINNPHGVISTMEYEEHRMPRSELTPQNRAVALDTPSPAATADVLETDTLYSPDGTEVQDVFGPRHQVQLENGLGTVVEAREHTSTTYDQGRPAGQDYHLPTRQITGARVCQPTPVDCPMTPGSSADADTRTTETDYDWQLRQPSKVTVDPNDLNLVSTLESDAATGLVTESSSPKANGADAHTTKTIYYSAGPNPQVPACGNKPEWANLACESLPVAQPSGPAPDLPTTTYEYGLWNQTMDVIDDAPGGTRLTHTDYDAAGRVTRVEITGGEGSPIAPVTTTYDPSTGRVAATSDGSSTIQRTYNAIGAQTSYQDADNVTSTVLAFDALGRPTWTSDGKGAQQVTYDDAGHVTTMIDTQVGAFNAGYNADGQLTGETMPNGLTLANGYDSTGNPTSRTYMNGSGEVMQFIEDSSIHGQVTRSVTEVGGAVSATDLESYDAAGRLKQSLDSTPSGGCSTENYTYDGDSNRTQQRSVAAIPGGSCDIDPNHGALRGHSYDEADRLIDTGYTYDAFGRSTAVPASDAGGDALTVDYYVDDVVRSMTQGSVTKTFLVDPGGRTRVTQTPGQTDEVSHFSDDSDAPSWTAQGTDWERYVAGIDGGLCAVQQGSGSNLGALSWQVTNIHGDTRGEVDGQGQLTTTFTTDEFGVPTGSVPSSGYGFLGGKQRKSQFASGVITMGQRVYVPQIGRFLQVDPVAGGSANDYDYANQDPVNNFDLTGETVYYAPHPGRGLICGFGGCKKRRPHRVVGVNIPGKLNCKTCSKVVITKKKCTADPQIAKTADEGYSPSYNDPATVECHYKATLFVPKFAAPRGLGNSIKVRKIALRFTCTEPIEINPDVPYEPLIPAGVTGDKCYGTTRRRLGSFYADKQAAVSGVAWY